MFNPVKAACSVAIQPYTAAAWPEARSRFSAAEQRWLELHDFTAKPGQYCLLPDHQGGIARVVAGYATDESLLWAIAGLPRKLPAGDYHLVCDWPAEARQQAAIGWGLGHYRFSRFQEKPDKLLPSLHVPGDQARIDAFVQAITLVRDLINLPANHMLPQHLAEAVAQLASEFAADYREVVGDKLLDENYPAIHAVGRASHHLPRLLELGWGDSNHPPVVLVGKGVCFDTGGLDLKPSQYMRLMKKDMGGAAHALGLARLVMQLRLPVRLRVLIPAVENAVGGDAFRPGDILSTRSGKHVEVDNTDAEGRLVLCDALTEAVAGKPELILDFATLTGAARVALGTEIPVFFSNDAALTRGLQNAAAQVQELIWPLPLHKPYLEQLKSQCADLLNSGGSYAGAITAALFLNAFVPETVPWAHFDVMAWNTRERAGRPVGGEAMGLFAVYSYLDTAYRLQS